MKRLFIVRHTTKDREALNEYDYDTELTSDGVEKAKKNGKAFSIKRTKY